MPDAAHPEWPTWPGRLAPLGIALLLAAAADASPWRAAVGADALRARLKTDTPDGSGVIVAMVEAPDKDRAFGPDRTLPVFRGVEFLGLPGTRWGSRHASTTTDLLLGRRRSFAPGIYSVEIFSSSQFLSRALAWRADTAGRPGEARVWNHSWVGGGGGQLLRQIDAMVQTEQLISLCGVKNRGANVPMLASTYNMLSVGRSDGKHARGAPLVDRVYGGGRVRPHLVAPMSATSAAVPLVSAAAALLVETGRDPRLSSDPLERSVTTPAGHEIPNAARNSVVYAALLAGANRNVVASSTAPDTDPVGYRGRSALMTDNGLDRRFGAGQLDVDMSVRIVAGGEHDSVQDRPDGRPAAPLGFDFDPQFGGAQDSNAEASWNFTATADGEFVAAVFWPAAVSAAPPATTGTRDTIGATSRPQWRTTIHDIDARLVELGDRERTVAESRGRSDNHEHIRIRVRADRRYRLDVRNASPDMPFVTELAVAWRMTSTDGR